VVTVEDNRSRHERRAIATRAIRPETLGLAGAQQVAQVQRTCRCPGAALLLRNLINPASLAAQLAAPADALAKALRAVLPTAVRKKLAPDNGAALAADLPAALVRGLNKLAKGPCLYDPVRFPEKILSDETRELRAQNPTGQKLAQLNRLLLCDAYPQELRTTPEPEFHWLATSRESARLGPEALLEINRGYWGIENGAFQRLDCSAMEDRLRVRDPNTVAVLGLFHRHSLAVFMAWARTQANPRDRTFPTWQARHTANRWLMIHQITKAPA
jgi:hypothetical protein